MSEEMETYRAAAMLAFDRMKSRGIKFTTWTCPYCGKPNDTVKPSPESVDDKGYWDGAYGCYECGDLSFVKTWPNGTTEVIKLKKIS